MKSDATFENRDEWLRYGQSLGWVSKLFCLTHDSLPLTEEEEDQLYDKGDYYGGEDPCVFLVRMIDTKEVLNGGREGWGAYV